MNASTNDLGVNRAARRSRPRSRALAATGVVAAGGAGALLAALAGSASAVTTITVDSAADGAGVAGNCTDGIVGNCTLRDASLAAVDGDTVTFDAGVSSITLTGGTVVFQAVSLTGSGSANLAITTTAAPNFYNIFEFSGTGDVVISGMSLTKNRIETQNVGNAKLLDVSISGSSGAYGGALYAGNDGNLEIVDSNFSQNYSTDNGGAVYAYNTGSVTISNSSFTNNDASSAGGAVFFSTNVTGSISITDSDFAGNHSDESGGAAMIYSDGTANLSISDSTFTDNDSSSWGGVLYIMDSIVDVTINGSSMSGNYSVSGSGVAYIENSGNLTITNSTFENNSSAGGSGALYLNITGDAIITNSLISGNSAAGGNGGGITKSNSGSLTINNSTLTGNSSLYMGGAIYGAGQVVINQSTITNNLAALGGGGIYLYSGSSVSLSGTIVSGNSATIGYADIATDTGNTLALTVNSSLLGDVDPLITVNGSNNISSTNPMVGALADNGGPTKTMALLDGSPAIDAGPDPVATFVGNDSDQRGLPWVRVFGGMVDIGAFEVQPDPVGPTTSTTAGTDTVVPAFTG